jgi:hypothetical protein
MEVDTSSLSSGVARSATARMVREWSPASSTSSSSSSYSSSQHAREWSPPTSVPDVKGSPLIQHGLREVSPPLVAGVPPASALASHLAQPQLAAHSAQFAGPAVPMVAGLPAVGMLPGYTVPLQPGMPLFTVGGTRNGAGPEVVMKKARRMQKNRESAAVSRKRKKEHLDTLEHSVQVLTADKENLEKRVVELEVENTHLKGEVESMRERLAVVGQQSHAGSSSSRPGSSLGSSSTTKLLACLVCVGLVSLSSGPGGYAPSGSAVLPHRSVTGRTLKASSMMAPEPLVSQQQRRSGGAVGAPRLRRSSDDEPTAVSKAASTSTNSGGDVDVEWLVEHQRWIEQHLNLTALESARGGPAPPGSATGT